jgi:hypothetical protein
MTIGSLHNSPKKNIDTKKTITTGNQNFFVKAEQIGWL